jgi:tetratricopeptide (TPR) repeat protein
MRIKPDFAFALVMLGRLCLKMENPDEAETYFRQATKLRPDNFAAHNELGWLLLQLGRFTEAEAPLRAALKLAQSADIMPGAHDRAEAGRMASLNLALSLHMQNRAMEAASLYRELLRLNPNDADAIRGLTQLRLTLEGLN